MWFVVELGLPSSELLNYFLIVKRNVIQNTLKKRQNVTPSLP